MRSFVDFDRSFAGQPRELGSLLARIDTGKGREALFMDQMPEVLGQLSADARIASITASNEIEGVVVGSERAARIAEGGGRYRNRNEREFAGYRDAMDELMRGDSREELSVPLILHIHRQLFAHAGGRGGHLKKDENLIVSYKGGHREVIFRPPPPQETEFLLGELLARYKEAVDKAAAHPLVLIGALILDFLAIHPVADGNGRVARLLTAHELLAHGYGVTRYVSIERRIFESRNSYYASLADSQRGWHETGHSVWPWITYVSRILADAYDDFEQRIAAAGEQSGSKQERVREHVLRQAPSEFSRRDIERALPDVSVATIRLVLAELRDEGAIGARGAGRGARWHRLG